MKKIYGLLSMAIMLIIASCTKTPEASFTSDKTTVEAGSEVKFTNTSVEGKSYLWNFGDGTTSTETSPTHTFTKIGSMTVTLTAYSKKEKKSASTTSTIVVNDVRDKFVGNFAGSETFTIGSLSNTSQTNYTIIKSSNFADRIIFDDGFPYATVSGNNFSIPSQSDNDVDSNGDPVVLNISSGSGVINGSTITFTYSGTYQDVSGTYTFTSSVTVNKQ